MRLIKHFVLSSVVITACLSSAIPCGPGYLTPLFDTTSAPEVPFTEFAAGRLGVLKPKLRRSVLIAAYRHIAGRGLTAFEQKALVEVWNAELNRADFPENEDLVDNAVKAWVAKRKEVLSKEEKPPAIYVERSYGGYEFFPNCTRSSFETATETLADRVSSHGADNTSVIDWVNAQDAVFANCATGKQMPAPAPVGAPVWLQKDRDYQLAAADFYSLNYVSAKRRFESIAQDTESPWRETADYLVARTLIRRASLSPTAEAAAPFYQEAEDHLARFVSSSGKFSASAERLTGLVKYRLRPRERVSELARNITMYSGENFRQDVIDYTWLLDKFESEVLNAEEKRKEAAKAPANTPASSTETSELPSNATANSNISAASPKKNPDDLEIYVYSVADSKSYQIHVAADATDEEALAEAERVIGKPLTDEIKTQVRDGRHRAYQNRFSSNQRPAYEGSYWGDERLSPSLVPAFVRQEEITDWLYTFQMSGAEAYLYSLKQWKSRGSDLWLLTALSQASISSTEVDRLLEAADTVDRSSAGYPTVAYHVARLLLAQGKSTEARKLIDSMLALGDTLPTSARNSFIDLRLPLAESMDDFLRYSLKKPFAFDFSGEVGTIEQIIATQKSYYNEEYHKEGREAYDREIDEEYKEKRLWQQREMLDAAAIEVLNQHFPTASLIEAYRSPALPEYYRPRLAIAIWTRMFLLSDTVNLTKFTPELIRHHPEMASDLESVTAARTPLARENTMLFFVLRNPILTPYLEDGIGRTDNNVEEWDVDDWWCEPYDSEYSEESGGEVARSLPPRPKAIQPAQTRIAQAERKRLKAAGDAPKFLGQKVLAWARRSPTDKRLPEVLYKMIVANGWTKYGCGNNEELRAQLTQILKARHGNTEWAAKLAEEQPDQ